MSNDSKSGGGSDLDIFEGLGKKTSEHSPAAPPPPPGSSATHVQASAPLDAKKTLLGIPNPASAAALPPPAHRSRRRCRRQVLRRVRRHRPWPLRPSRGSADAAGLRLDARGDSGRACEQSRRPRRRVEARCRTSPPRRATRRCDSAAPASGSAERRAEDPVGPAADARPGSHGPAARTARSDVELAHRLRAGKERRESSDMDWDDDQEATHVFDKDKEKLSADSSSESLTPPEEAKNPRSAPA